MNVSDAGIVEIVRLLGATHIRASVTEAQLAEVRTTLHVGLDRAKEDSISAPLLAIVAMNALAVARQPCARQLADANRTIAGLQDGIRLMRAEHARELADLAVEIEAAKQRVL